MNYEILTVKGYWNNDLLKSKGYVKNYSEIESDVNIALGYWETIGNNEIDEETDNNIFYYYDLEHEEKPKIEVGDIISDGFVITKIY